MTTTSNRIRQLALEGMAVADIARALNIRYQHARKVLLDSELIKVKSPRTGTPVKAVATKPVLNVDLLVQCGFKSMGHWTSSQLQDLNLPPDIPKIPGVYAFGIDGIVQYVGVATMGLSKRLYFYGKPGRTQKTSVRINATLKEQMANNLLVEVLIAIPEDFLWNGLPVHGGAGLELGLIKAFALPWNLRSAK